MPSMPASGAYAPACASRSRPSAPSFIRLRYVGRHDLESGRLVTWVGYLRWLHPLRGEIRAAEFLKVAETTGLATTLSRAVLSGLGEDFARLTAAAHAEDRKSTRLNSSHSQISYAVFCLK